MQASFETVSNFGAYTTEPLSPSPIKETRFGNVEHANATSPERNSPAGAANAAMVGRMLDSRSSVMLPLTSSQRQDSKLRLDETEENREERAGHHARVAGLYNSGERDERVSMLSNESLPYNTDINVERI